MGYLRRQLFVSALIVNAIRPVPGAVAGVPSMFAGWFISELAPHFIVGTAVDTGLEVLRTGGRGRHALLGAANLAGLGFVMRQGSQSRAVFDSTLLDGLGPDYLHQLQQRHPDLDWKTPVRQLVWPFRSAVQGFEVDKNITYAPEHGRRGQLDVYRPKDGASGAPVLLQIHGGAWILGSKDQQGLPLMRHMASRGWVCVAPNYRLSPRDRWPAQIVDVKRTIAWIRQHGEEYGADPRFIAITGGSAGGHLAALAALTPNDPEYQPEFEGTDTTLQAAVPFYGVYDLAGITGSKAVKRMRDRFLGPRVFGEDPERNIEPFEKASPLARVRRDAPPFYVIHGSNDSLVDIRQAREFVQALREVSEQAVAYTELSGTQHAFDVFPSVRSQHSVRGVDRFLRWAYDSWRGASARSHEEMERRGPVEDRADDPVDA